MSIGAPSRNDFNVEEYTTTPMAADLVLQLEDADTMVLDPTEARNVDLPPVVMGAKVTIVNAAGAAEDITVRLTGAGATVGVVGQNEVGVFYCDGTTWHHMTGVA